MLANLQAHVGLTRPFHRVGNYETEHQRTLVREVCAVVQTGRLVVVAGLVGSGKTHLLTRIEDELARSSKIAIAKSLAVDKRRTSLPSLIEAMFYDLTPGDRGQVKIPKQPEHRERDLRDLMRKNRQGPPQARPALHPTAIAGHYDVEFRHIHIRPGRHRASPSAFAR